MISEKIEPHSHRLKITATDIDVMNLGHHVIDLVFEKIVQSPDTDAPRHQRGESYGTGYRHLKLLSVLPLVSSVVLRDVPSVPVETFPEQCSA